MITLVSGCAGDGESPEQTGPSHAVPHPDIQMLAEAKANGESISGAPRTPGAQQPPDHPGVNLQHEPEADQHCGNCSLYVPDQNGDGFGACLSVSGKIHPYDWCVLYTEHAAEGVVSCAQAYRRERRGGGADSSTVGPR